jgi:hypothetical protein
MVSHRCSPLMDYRWPGSLVHRFHGVLGTPQSLKSLRENGLQATYSIGEIIEQNLQADKQKISRSTHIIIRINKHYYHIIHDVPHPYSWMSHVSHLLAAHPDYTDVKLLSSRTTNQAYSSQFAQLPAKKATDINLGAYLGRQPSSSLHDVLTHFIIVPNGDAEGETAHP